LEEFENIKNWDIIKDGDDLESNDSKMRPFADDLNINDDFYLTKGQSISESLVSAFNFPIKQLLIIGSVVAFYIYMWRTSPKWEDEEKEEFKKDKEQRIIEKLKILSQDQFSDSDDSDDEESSLKNPGKNLENVYHVLESSNENFKNFEYFEKLKK
jgi:hypothetical protein